MYPKRRLRKMYTPRNGQVWLCSKCNQPIEKLPFLPAMDQEGNLIRPVYHYDCLPARNQEN